MKTKSKFLRHATFEDIEKEKAPTCISLFTGCGGIDVGFGNAGIQTRVMVEWSKDCCETLRANWHWSELQKRQKYRFKGSKAIPIGPLWKSKSEMKKCIRWYHEPEPVIINEDITKVSTENILYAANLKVGEAMVVAGGPPCQGFSTSGKRMINDPRNRLFKEFVRVVKEALPRMFFFENVPGLVSMAKGKIIKQICEEFAVCGYDVSWKILNAADYGVPQNRHRVIMIGKRVDIMRINEEGRMQVYIGCGPGRITHPEDYIKKYGGMKEDGNRSKTDKP